MYHALLTNRYLTSRVIPLIAVAAVALCVALVIIVVSVMTGFLDMVKNSGRKLMGDVVISYQVSGIPYYERLIDRIQALPQAAAATPVVDGVGVLQMPYPDGPIKQNAHALFWGIEPKSFAEVTGYKDTLYWKELNTDQWERLLSDVLAQHWSELLTGMTDDQRIDLLRRMFIEDDPNQPPPDDAQLRERIANISTEAWRHFLTSRWDTPQMLQAVLSEAQWNALLAHDPRLLDPNLVYDQGLSLRCGAPAPGNDLTIVLGMHVSEGNERQRDGSYMAVGEWRWWMPRYQVMLMTIPTTGGLGGADSAERRILNVVNEFVSGVFVIDKHRVMIPISIAQEMLHLDQSERMDDPDDPFRVTGIEPAKATMILVRAATDVTPEQLRSAGIDAYEQFARELASEPGTVPVPPYGFGLNILTWAQQQASFIGPVEKEREMMRILFSIIYLVCAGLILAIFWAIVHEKTRDIGILRSIGASRGGILWIFLRYGLIVGVIGSVAGVALAYAVVRNINAIHAAIGEDAPVWLWIGVFAAAVLVLLAILSRIRSPGMMFMVLWTVFLVAILIVDIGLIFHRGTLVWDPSVYYFSEIPNQLDVATAMTTMIGAVVFSLLGAFIPAAKAADIDPVHALRYE